MSSQRQSLQRKHAARMAAVQALYCYGMSDTKPSAQRLFEQLRAQWDESVGIDSEWPMDLKPEQAMLRDVIEGTLQHLEQIDSMVTGIVKATWKTERMDPVMLAILRCAVYELAHKPERKSQVILDEYVTIAGGYFDGQELGFVHSALQQLAPAIRL